MKFTVVNGMEMIRFVINEFYCSKWNGNDKTMEWK